MAVNKSELTQSPAAGSRHVMLRGQTITIELRASGVPGTARCWLRTNAGRAGTHRRDVIDEVDAQRPRLERDWHDVEMENCDNGVYRTQLPLAQVGTFVFKAYCLPQKNAEAVWPAGENTVVKVEPAHTAAGNTIYTAFVRQFLEEAEASIPAAGEASPLARLDQTGYTVIPPSGTFRALARQLDTIIDDMGFRILQLLPIHPVPTTYARMGRYGSPFAALDFYAVDPALAEFDRHTTPMCQFEELVDAVHARSAYLYLDLPVNHTGWASQFQAHHPEWFVRHAEKGFVSPGAWGITWDDLSQLDYSIRELWREMAEVFLFWCRRGVDGFRCDAGYMIPAQAWEYLTARVREEFPDTVFLLEGLGGDVRVVEDLIGRAGLDWAYSEVFQNYDRAQLENYLPSSFATSATRGLLIHFAETHDNARLAATSPEFSRLRLLLCALTAPAGSFGITAGVEWLATEKIDVHGAPSLQWGAKTNQVELIARVNRILNNHPCFLHGATLRVIPQKQEGQTVVVERIAPDGSGRVLVAANTDLTTAGDAIWDAAAGPCDDACNLLDEQPVRLFQEDGSAGIRLSPGEVVLLADEPCPAKRRQSYGGEPRSCMLQRGAALLLDLACHAGVTAEGAPEEEAVRALLHNPVESYRAISGKAYVPAVRFTWPRDEHRTVCVMPNHLLLVEAPCRFRVQLLLDKGCIGESRSLPGGRIGHFAILLPASPHHAHLFVDLKLVAYTTEGTRHCRVPICLLAPWQALTPDLVLTTPQVRARDVAALCTNGRGGMAIARGAWGTLQSQYDALLAANLDPAVPVDRRVMLRRYRVWLRHSEFSREMDVRSLRRFAVDEQGNAHWHFHVPMGMGHSVVVDACLTMPRGANRSILTLQRGTVEGHHAELADDEPVVFILRPDVEDRSCHEATRALDGAERTFPKGVTARPDGFDFSPWGDHSLRITASAGSFSLKPEWAYEVKQPFETQRGLHPSTDIFSPGYFSCTLTGGTELQLISEAAPDTDRELPELTERSDSNPMLAVLRRAISSFIVARDERWTVIAGYPWFLDWGRDTLICLPGMIRAGFVSESRDILLQFASFEQDGTLPNMIRGKDCTDRDTSDAPLWFFVACRDLMEVTGAELLDAACGERTLREVLLALAEGYLAGTPNGIFVDDKSGLVHSPSHFTWMDTNYPAGTPRQGYPIELQALWHAACTLLCKITGEARWKQRAERAETSVAQLYIHPGGGLVDCLHTDDRQPANAAVADDAIRCNQLLAVSLGLVTDTTLTRGIVDACAELLLPGGIRSLADRPVSHPLHVERDGVQLNDPLYPYWGHYEGDEDTRRKPAYHNGTGWSWVFPLFSECLGLVYGEDGMRSGLDLLGSSLLHLESGCLGQVPEVMDGNRPHWPRGCMAQAWGVTELYRVAHTLETQLQHAHGKSGKRPRGPKKIAQGR